MTDTSEIRRFTKCCGCFSLRTGSLIVGALSMIWPVIIIFLVVEYHVKNEKDYMGPVIITLIVIASIALLISFCLILGTIMRNPRMMKLWLYFNMIVIVLYTMFSVRYALALMRAGLFQAALIYFLMRLICILISYYLWGVVHAHVQELEADSLNDQMSAGN